MAAAEPLYEFLTRVCWDTFGFRLDLEASVRIDCFLDLLEVWNRRLRLTGERERATLLRKHVVDSLSCVPVLPERGPALDIGTGAGFPGIVLACARPDVPITLLDARQRPISFLREVISRVPLPRATALAMRAEAAAGDVELAGRQRFVSSRALRIDVFLTLAEPLVAPDGVAVSMQTPKLGREAADTVARASGFRVADLRDYRLPDGELRRLVVLAR